MLWFSILAVYQNQLRSLFKKTKTKKQNPTNFLTLLRLLKPDSRDGAGKLNFLKKLPSDPDVQARVATQ